MTAFAGEAETYFFSSPRLLWQFPVWFTEGRAKKVPVIESPGFEADVRRRSACTGDALNGPSDLRGRRVKRAAILL